MAVTRSYESPLREAQTEATRARILDALVRVLSGGLAEVSIPAVAREAGISPRTLYRHFASKRALLDALDDHISRQTGFHDVQPPDSPQDLAELMRIHLPKVAGRDPAIAAAMATADGRATRQRSIDARLGYVDRALAAVRERVDRDTYAKLRDAILIFMTSETLEFQRTYLGRTPEEAAETSRWAILALTGAAEHVQSPRDDR